MGRKILIGCGALSVLAVLVIVFIVVVAAVSGGGGHTASNSGAGGGSGSNSSSSGGQQAVAVGQPVKVGNVKWIVTNARQASQLTSPLGDSKQGRFVVVDFDFTNNGNEAVTLDSSSLTLLDGRGRKFETDTDASEYVEPSKDIFLDQVNPGVTKQGEVIFTVAQDASNFKLQAGDTDMFSDNNGYVNLGF